MSTLSGLHGSVFALLLLGELAADKLVYTHKMNKPHDSSPANGAVPTFPSDESFAEGLRVVAHATRGNKKQYASKNKTGVAPRRLFQQIKSSALAPSNSSSSGDSPSTPQSTSSAPSDGERATKVSSAHVRRPDYFYDTVSLTPYVPPHSVNSPPYISGAEGTKTSISEPWEQSFMLLSNTGSWQNLFAFPDKWELHPDILRGGHSGLRPFTGNVEQQRAHADEAAGTQAVSYSRRLWTALSILSLWFPSRVLLSRSSASLTTCILCALVVFYFYLLFRLVLLCGRLRHEQRHTPPAVYNVPSCFSQYSPQQHDLPSGALLIGSHSSSRSGSMKSATWQDHVSCERLDTTYRSDPESNEVDTRGRRPSMLSDSLSPGRFPATSAGRWQCHTALRGWRCPLASTRSHEDEPWLIQSAKVFAKMECWRQPRDDVEQQEGEERTHVLQSKSMQTPEQPQHDQLDEREQQAKQVAEYENEIDFSSCREAAEEREDSPSGCQAAYVILCYPGVWRATAYNPYLLESCMRCIRLSSKVRRYSWDPPHKRKTCQDTSSTRGNFSDESHPTVQGEAAMHLAATYVRHRSFVWWKAYLAVCCGYICCLLGLSVYSDVVRFSSLDISVTSGKLCLVPSPTVKVLGSRSCAHIKNAPLSSLFHAREKQCALSAVGAVIALVQWLASLCLLRACLVDFSQITVHRQTTRSKAKAEAAVASLSLLYVFLLFCLVASASSGSALVRSSRSLPTIFDLDHVNAHTQQWHIHENVLWRARFFSQHTGEFGVPTTRQDRAAVAETAKRRNEIGDIVAGRGEILRPKIENIDKGVRRPSSVEAGENHGFATTKLPDATIWEKMNYTAADDVNMTRGLPKEHLKNVQRSSDTQDQAPPNIPIQRQRLATSNVRKKQLGVPPNVRQQQPYESERRAHESDSQDLHGRDIELTVTAEIMLLSLCHAVPRLWALYAVWKLVREDDFSIMRRNSRAEPSFRALVWGVGLSLMDLLPLPFVTQFLEVRCVPLEMLPVCGIDVLLCLQGVHFYLLFAHARREISTTEDSTHLKRAISNMQQTFQLNVFR